MSPEQVRATPVDGRSDLYSLGMTLFEMITNRRPLTADNAYSTIKAQVNQPPPSPALYNSTLPRELCAAVLKALEKDPARRFQSAIEFSRELRTVRDRALQGAPPLASLTVYPAFRKPPAPCKIGSYFRKLRHGSGQLRSGRFGTRPSPNCRPRWPNGKSTCAAGRQTCRYLARTVPNSSFGNSRGERTRTVPVSAQLIGTTIQKANRPPASAWRVLSCGTCG